MLIFLIFVIAILAIFFIFPYLLISANPFPQPSGKWQVGTTDLIWDRPDLSGIIAKVWYPTETENNLPTPYIDRIDAVLSALTAGKNPLYMFIFKLYLSRIKTPVARDAILGDTLDGFPVILFSAGLGGINVGNTFYALEFASHGAIVVGINHPGSSSITLLSDGSVIGVNGKTKEFFSNGVKFLKDNPTEFARLVNETAGEIMPQQANNFSYVLDKVIELNSTTNSFLDRKVNEAKIFAAGHSAGGSASFLACGQDLRIAKGVNFDGYLADPNSIGNSTNYQDKELLLITSDREKYPKDKDMRRANDLLYTGDEIRIKDLATKTNLQRIGFQLAGHLNFSDLPLLLTIPALARLTGIMGEIDERKLLKETAMMAIEFFNNQ